jgi:hypothetical protein
VICWDISGVEGVSQCSFYCGVLLLWVKVACGSVSEPHSISPRETSSGNEGEERVGPIIYSGIYLIKVNFT